MKIPLIAVSLFFFGTGFIHGGGPATAALSVAVNFAHPEKFTYASGSVIKEGKRSLTNPTFLMETVRGLNHDPLRYDKELLAAWSRREFRSR